MSHGGAILSDIYEKLSTSKIQVYDDCVRHRDIISRANTLADSLLTAPPSVESFRDFLKTTYNFYVDTDILVKTCLLRTIRLCISSPASRVSLQLSACLIETEWHYLIITSIEREPLIESVEEWRGGGEMVTQDYLIERMQAIKLTTTIIRVSPHVVPLSIARSLVSVASDVKDTSRKVCLETLRQLCVFNPRIAIMSHAFSTLLEVVTDINTNFDDMVDSIVQTLLYMLNNPHSRKYLRPHVDLRYLIAPFTDTDASEEEVASKCLRSKRVLVLILRSHVGVSMISADDLGLPTLVRMLRDVKVPKQIQQILLDTFSEVFEPVFARVKRSRIASSSGSSGCRVVSINSKDGVDDANDNAVDNSAGTLSRINTIEVVEEEKKTKTVAFSTPNHSSGSKSNNAGNSTSASAPTSKSTPKTPRSKSIFQSIFGSSKKDEDDEKGISEAKKKRGSAGRMVEGVVNMIKRSSLSKSPRNDPGSDALGGESTYSSAGYTTSGLYDDEMDPGLIGHSSVSLSAMGGEVYSDNVVYNLLESYAAILSAAFIHSELIESLCYLSTHGDLHLSRNARNLLVDFLRTIAHVFPESKCAALANVPNLIAYSTIFSNTLNLKTSMLSYRASKANALLNHIADAFSVAPREFRVIPSVNETVNMDMGENMVYTKKKRGSEVSHPGDDMSWDEAQTSIYSGVSGNTMTYRQGDDSTYQFQFSGVSSGGWDGPGMFDEVTLCGLGECMKSVYTPNVSAGAPMPNFMGRYALRQRLNGNKSDGTSSTTVNTEANKTNNSSDVNGPHDYDGSDFYIIGTGNNTGISEDLKNHQRDNHMSAIQKLRLLASTNSPSSLDFNKLMESTRVLGKDGKEPFRWDWTRIYEMLEHAFDIEIDTNTEMNSASKSRRRSGVMALFGSSKSDQKHDLDIVKSVKSKRLEEAMKTKWIRRVSGFFRCSSDEKAYFARIPWDLVNMTFLDCGSLLYDILVHDINGQSFLKHDRRGTIFKDATSQLKMLIEVVEKMQSSTYQSVSKKVNATPTLMSNVRSSLTYTLSTHFDNAANTAYLMGDPNGCLFFRLQAMKTSMTREYFTLLGKLAHTPGGRTLINDTDIVSTLCNLGKYPSLDYISRAVLTSLIFSDKGYISKVLIESWCNGHPISPLTQAMARSSSLYDPSLSNNNNLSNKSSAEGGGRGGLFSSFKSMSSSSRNASSKSTEGDRSGVGPPVCSLALRSYIYDLLHVLRVTNPRDFRTWGIDLVVHLIGYELPFLVNHHLIRLLLQLCQSCEDLIMFIEKLDIAMTVDATREDILRKSSAASGDGDDANYIHNRYDITQDTAYFPVLSYFLTVPQGVRYVHRGAGPLSEGGRRNTNWINANLKFEGIYGQAKGARGDSQGSHGGENDTGSSNKVATTIEEGDEDMRETLADAARNDTPAHTFLHHWLHDFTTHGCRKWTLHQEKTLSRALNKEYVRKQLCPCPLARPIPYLNKNLSSTYSNTTIQPDTVLSEQIKSDRDGSSTSNVRPEDPLYNILVRDVRGATGAKKGTKGSFTNNNTTKNDDKNKGDNSRADMVTSSTRSSSIDLQGLMRTPWNVDIRLCRATNTNQSSDNGSKNGSKGLSDLGTNEVEYLKTDSYLDCSDLTDASCQHISSDDNHYIKVRTRVLGSNGLPICKEVDSLRNISTTLMAGVCPVLRTGQVLGVASSFHLQQKQAQRERESQSNSSTPTGNRRGSTAGRMGATQTSAGSSGPNLGEMNLGQLYNSYDPIYAHTEDRPASLGMETCYDWTTCTGSHRETKGEGVTELGQGFFSIQISNEPCVYIFSRRPFHTKDGEGVDSWGGGEDSPRGGGKVNNSYDGGDVECSDGVDLLMPFTNTITKATQNASNSTTVDGIAANSMVNSEYLYSTQSGTPTHNPAAVLEQRQRRASHSSYQAYIESTKDSEGVVSRAQAAETASGALLQVDPTGRDMARVRNERANSFAQARRFRDSQGSYMSTQGRNSRVGASDDGSAASGGMGGHEGGNKPLLGKRDGKVYLVEVHYYLQIFNGTSTIAAPPPHLLGQIAKTNEGCLLLCQELTLGNTSILKYLISSLLYYEGVTEGVGNGVEKSSEYRNIMAIQSRNASYKEKGNGDGPAGNATPDDILSTSSSLSIEDMIDVERRRVYTQACQCMKEILLALGHIASSESGWNAVQQVAMEIAEAATEASTPSTGGEKDDDDESDSPATPTPTGSGLPPIPPLEGASAGNANASTLSDTTPFNLIRWCLKSVGSHSHYGIRGTVFTVLGLLSRTTQGRQTLNKFKWESAPVDYHSSVTIPKSSSFLFRRNIQEEAVYDGKGVSAGVPEYIRRLLELRATPSSSATMSDRKASTLVIGNLGGDVLRLKLMELLFITTRSLMSPLQSKDSLQRIDRLKQDCPEIFKSRYVYKIIHRTLESCRFKLEDRRRVLGWFAKECLYVDKTADNDDVNEDRNNKHK